MKREPCVRKRAISNIQETFGGRKRRGSNITILWSQT